MKIIVIDGQGGKLGYEIISAINKCEIDSEIIAIGTNAIATQTMLKAKPTFAATGENPVVVNTKNADYIIGPIGIVIADSLFGEITSTMALAISKSNAKRILIPINKCNNLLVGVKDNTLDEKITEVIKILKTK